MIDPYVSSQRIRNRMHILSNTLVQFHIITTRIQQELQFSEVDIDGLELEELETRKSFIEDVTQGEPLKILKLQIIKAKIKIYGNRMSQIPNTLRGPK